MKQLREARRSVELKPCPRCLCPFVEHVVSLSPATGDWSDWFTCHGCGLNVRLPRPGVANAVELWNAWPRTNTVELTAQAATAQAEAIRANAATRLERLTVALIRASLPWSWPPHAPIAENLEAHARAVVMFARAVDRELDIGDSL